MTEYLFAWMAGGLDKAGQGAAIVQQTLEELHAHDRIDQHHEAAQGDDISDARDCCKDRLHEHRHPGHPLQSAQRAQRPEGADDCGGRPGTQGRRRQGRWWWQGRVNELAAWGEVERIRFGALREGARAAVGERPPASRGWRKR